MALFWYAFPVVLFYWGFDSSKIETDPPSTPYASRVFMVLGGLGFVVITIWLLIR